MDKTTTGDKDSWQKHRQDSSLQEESLQNISKQIASPMTLATSPYEGGKGRSNMSSIKFGGKHD